MYLILILNVFNIKIQDRNWGRSHNVWVNLFVGDNIYKPCI